MRKLALLLALTLTGSVFGQISGLDYYEEVKPNKKSKLFKKSFIQSEEGVKFWFEGDDTAYGLQLLLNEAFLLSVENGLEFDITLYQAKEATIEKDQAIELEYEFNDGSFIVILITQEETIVGGLCKNCK